MSTQKLLFLFVIFFLAIASGCSPVRQSNVPSDFTLIMDVHSVGDGPAQNVNIRIDAEGKGQYERYNTEGTIKQDTNDMVVYDPEQVVDKGKFRVSQVELEQLWKAINENNFFDLDEEYSISLGHSYAFIKVEANGQSHQVFNIGLEVPELRAIVEAVKLVLPAEVHVEYGEGLVP